MLMIMRMALGTPMVTQMLMPIAMAMLMLMGHSAGNCHSPLTCGNANGDGNAIHPVTGQKRKTLIPPKGKTIPFFWPTPPSKDPVN